MLGDSMIKNNKLLFISTILFGLLTQGCETDSRSQPSTPKSIGESTSVVINEPNAKMAPNKHTLSDISQIIASIIQLHVQELNQKEAISFNTETNYCDISGLKNLEHSGNLSQIQTISNYEACQGEKQLQNGTIQIKYSTINNEGKFPKNVEIKALNQYKFNYLQLEKNLYIESHDIQYRDDNSLKSMRIKINGNLTFYTQEIELTNHTATINF